MRLVRGYPDSLKGEKARWILFRAGKLKAGGQPTCSHRDKRSHLLGGGAQNGDGGIKGDMNEAETGVEG